MTTKIVIKGFDELAKRLDKDYKEIFSKALGEISDAVLESVIMETPKRTGDTQLSNTLKKQSVLEYHITTGDVGAMLIKGVKAHKIYPSRALALYWDGAPHPLPMVNHPGFPKNDFHIRGVKEAQKDINSILNSFGADVLT